MGLARPALPRRSIDRRAGAVLGAVQRPSGVYLAVARPRVAVGVGHRHASPHRAEAAALPADTPAAPGPGALDDAAGARDCRHGRPRGFCVSSGLLADVDGSAPILDPPRRARADHRHRRGCWTGLRAGSMRRHRPVVPAGVALVWPGCAGVAGRAAGPLESAATTVVVAAGIVGRPRRRGDRDAGHGRRRGRRLRSDGTRELVGDDACRGGHRRPAGLARVARPGLSAHTGAGSCRNRAVRDSRRDAVARRPRHPGSHAAVAGDRRLGPAVRIRRSSRSRRVVAGRTPRSATGLRQRAALECHRRADLPRAPARPRAGGPVGRRAAGRRPTLAGPAVARRGLRRWRRPCRDRPGIFAERGGVARLHDQLDVGRACLGAPRRAEDACLEQLHPSADRVRAVTARLRQRGAAFLRAAQREHAQAGERDAVRQR